MPNTAAQNRIIITEEATTFVTNLAERGVFGEGRINNIASLITLMIPLITSAIALARLTLNRR